MEAVLALRTADGEEYLTSSSRWRGGLDLKAMHSPWKHWHMHGECRHVCMSSVSIIEGVSLSEPRWNSAVCMKKRRRYNVLKSQINCTSATDGD